MVITAVNMDQLGESLKTLSFNGWENCEICGGYYPRDKHNFEECYTTDPDWDLLMIDTDFSILNEYGVIKWFNCIKIHDNIEDEKDWGNDLIQKYCGSKKYTVQWTTALGEYVVKLLLILNGHVVITKQKLEKYDPDVETSNTLFEVKSRNYNTNGTAGEKILGTVLKYAALPKLYKKKYQLFCAAIKKLRGAKNLSYSGVVAIPVKKYYHFTKN